MKTPGRCGQGLVVLMSGATITLNLLVTTASLVHQYRMGRLTWDPVIGRITIAIVVGCLAFTFGLIWLLTKRERARRGAAAQGAVPRRRHPRLEIGCPAAVLSPHNPRPAADAASNGARSRAVMPLKMTVG